MLNVSNVNAKESSHSIRGIYSRLQRVEHERIRWNAFVGMCLHRVER